MGKDIGAGEYQLSPYQDFIVVRYSDVLLMAAELGSPNAQSLFWMQCVIALFGGDTSKRVTATKENILKERMYEFCFLKGCVTGICFVRVWKLLLLKLPKLVLCSVVAWKT